MWSYVKPVDWTKSAVEFYIVHSMHYQQLIHDTKPTSWHSTVLTFVKYVGCFQDTLYQGPVHL